MKAIKLREKENYDVRMSCSLLKNVLYKILLLLELKNRLYIKEIHGGYKVYEWALCSYCKILINIH